VLRQKRDDSNFDDPVKRADNNDQHDSPSYLSAGAFISTPDSAGAWQNPRRSGPHYPKKTDANQDGRKENEIISASKHIIGRRLSANDSRLPPWLFIPTDSSESCSSILPLLYYA